MKYLSRRQRLLKNGEGFTLIEVMVVVVIIGVLSAIALPTFEGQFNRTKVGRAVAEVKSLMNLVELYKIEHGEYPEVSKFEELVKENGFPDWGEAGEKGFRDPWENPYHYYVSTDKTKYCLWSDGPKGEGTKGILASEDKREPLKDQKKPSFAGMTGTLSCTEGGH